jgi:GxxExxY protein
MEEELRRELTALSERVIGAAIAVHRELGPGFLESIYSHALRLELDARGFAFECEKPVAVMYRGVAIPGQRVDFVVDRRMIVEVKAVAALEPIHLAQVLSYLKTTGLRLGLLFNFHERLLAHGIRRVAL